MFSRHIIKRIPSVRKYCTNATKSNIIENTLLLSPFVGGVYGCCYSVNHGINEVKKDFDYNKDLNKELFTITDCLYIGIGGIGGFVL